MRDAPHWVFYTGACILGAVFLILLFGGCGSGAELSAQFPPYFGPVVALKFSGPSPTPTPTPVPDAVLK